MADDDLIFYRQSLQSWGLGPVRPPEIPIAAVQVDGLALVQHPKSRSGAMVVEPDLVEEIGQWLRLRGILEWDGEYNLETVCGGYSWSVRAVIGARAYSAGGETDGPDGHLDALANIDFITGKIAEGGAPFTSFDEADVTGWWTAFPHGGGFTGVARFDTDPADAVQAYRDIVMTPSAHYMENLPSIGLDITVGGYPMNVRVSVPEDDPMAFVIADLGHTAGG